MRRRFGMWGFAVAAISAAAPVAGCGGDDDSGSEAEGGTSGAGGASAGSGTAASGAGATSAGAGGAGGAAGEPGFAGAGGDAGGAGGGSADPCAEIEAACADYDLGPGPVRDCRELAEDGDATACAEELAACRTACGAGGELPFTIAFSGRVGSEAFSCASTYEGLGSESSTVHPVDFKFYVDDLRLIDEAGDEVAVTLEQDGTWQHESVALIDFEDKAGSCANGTTETNDRILGTVPHGKYRGIAFEIGVPFELNHSDVATAPSPLNLTSMYWGWNFGRLFLSIMNETETPELARPTFVTLLHVGSADCVGDAENGGVTSCARPNRPEYRFPEFRPGSNVMVADMKEVLSKSNLRSDLCHSFAADVCPWPFELLGINWSTGTLTPSTQRFFRVE